MAALPELNDADAAAAGFGSPDPMAVVSFATGCSMVYPPSPS
jgi:hypothetical protein